MYKFLDHGVHAEVLDFRVRSPTAKICARPADYWRVPVDVAETALLQGEPLPQPDSSCTEFRGRFGGTYSLAADRNIPSQRCAPDGLVMKRRGLLRHLYQHGCRLVREGSEYSPWENPINASTRFDTTLARFPGSLPYTSANNWKHLRPLEDRGRLVFPAAREVGPLPWPWPRRAWRAGQRRDERRRRYWRWSR